MKNLKNNNQGFTLVEIIVAVSILALVLVPIFQVFIVGVNTTNKAQNYGTVTEALENTMEVVKGAEITELGDALARIGTVTLEPEDGKEPGSEAAASDGITEFFYRMDNVSVGQDLGAVKVKVGATTSESGGMTAGELASVLLPYAQYIQTNDALTDPDQLAIVQLQKIAQEDIFSNYDDWVVLDSEITLTGRSIDLSFYKDGTLPSSTVPRIRMDAIFSYTATYTYRGTTYNIEYVADDLDKIVVSPSRVPTSTPDQYSFLFAYYPVYFASATEKITISNPENLPIDLFLNKQLRQSYIPNGTFGVTMDASYRCELILQESSGSLPSGQESFVQMYSNISWDIYTGTLRSPKLLLKRYVGSSYVASVPYTDSLVKTESYNRFYEVTIDIYQYKLDSSGGYIGGDDMTLLSTLTSYKLV